VTYRFYGARLLRLGLHLASFALCLLASIGMWSSTRVVQVRSRPSRGRLWGDSNYSLPTPSRLASASGQSIFASSCPSNNSVVRFLDGKTQAWVACRWIPSSNQASGRATSRTEFVVFGVSTSPRYVLCLISVCSSCKRPRGFRLVQLRQARDRLRRTPPRTILHSDRWRRSSTVQP
jgi:hypothetical protein